jgi:hypothetical protein
MARRSVTARVEEQAKPRDETPHLTARPVASLPAPPSGYQSIPYRTAS